MSTHIEFEITPIEEADAAIFDAIKAFFLKEASTAFIDPQLESDISNYLTELKDTLWCFIEYPYVDKVYRDSYYNYYASKHSTYQRDCIRVSLFRDEIKAEDFVDPTKHSGLNEKYLGFFVIRPTLNAPFGRSTINPEAFIHNEFKICSCKATSMVYGVKVETTGFPHSSQDRETIKCAETTIWAIMEYFGNKYVEYKPTLPSKIHKALESISIERQLPSDGLTMDEISYALKSFGFGTRIYSRMQYKKINNIVDCYIESGIPVLTGLETLGNEQGHVIITVGKKYEKEINWSKVETSVLKARGKDVTYIDSTDIPAKHVVQDDNLEPYRLIDLKSPGEHYEDDDSKAYSIFSIIVPLYPKIYLEAVVAKQLFLQIIKDDKLGYDFANNFVFRYFLASSRSFKNHISSLVKIDNELKISILSLKMPKFIWCGEFYSKEGFSGDERSAEGIVILDATEANSTNIDALIFAGYPDRCISMIENNFASLRHKLEYYTYFSNLR